MAPPGSRIIALDLGLRRIGLAISDPLGLTAQGLPTLLRRRLHEDLDALDALARQRQACLWLLGLPRQMNGEEGSQAHGARRFGAALARRTRLPVHYWDERLTTVEAGRVLAAAGATLAQRQRAVDRMAAVILLQSYLDRSATLGCAPPADIVE